MRWERLFEDLEAQALAAEGRACREEVADRTRRERAATTLLDRLAAVPALIVVEVVSGLRIEGAVKAVGRDWFVLEQSGRAWLIPQAGVVEIRGLREGGTPADVGRRFGLGLALRALSRDRAAVTVHDRTGRVIQGRIEAVGADWLDLVDWPARLSGRSDHGSQRRCLPWPQIAAVMSRAPAVDGEPSGG